MFSCDNRLSHVIADIEEHHNPVGENGIDASTTVTILCVKLMLLNFSDLSKMFRFASTHD